MGKKFQEEISSGEDSDWDEPEDKKKEVKAFSGNSTSLSDKHFIDYDKFGYTHEDYEIVLSIRDSLEEAFKTEAKAGISVAFRHPNGKK